MADSLPPDEAHAYRTKMTRTRFAEPLALMPSFLKRYPLQYLSQVRFLMRCLIDWSCIVPIADCIHAICGGFSNRTGT